MAEDELIRQIEEDLARERIANAFKRYGPMVIGGIILLLVIVIGWQAWQRHEHAAKEEQSVIYYKTLQDDKAKADIKLTDVKLTGGYAMLDLFNRARKAADKNTTAEAVKLYDQIADNQNFLPVYRELAGLYAAYALFENKADDKSLAARLEKLSAPDSGFRASAMELQAMLAMKNGDNKKAREKFDSILKLEGAPKSIVYRARKIKEMTKQ